MSQERQVQIQGFVSELAVFAKKAESTLSEIEGDLEANRALLSGFAGMMLTIRGTAQQLGFNHVAQIATLGEEIAVKGVTAETRPKVRRCIGSLWDVITSVKYLIEHEDRDTGEEQQILIHRLETTLGSLGGSRVKVEQSDIEALLKQQQ